MSDSPCLPHDAQLLAALLKAHSQEGEVPVFGDGSQSLGPVSHRPGTPTLPCLPVTSMFTPPRPCTSCFFCFQSPSFYGVSQSVHRETDDLGWLTNVPLNNTGSRTEEVIPFPCLF